MLASGARVVILKSSSSVPAEKDCSREIVVCVMKFSPNWESLFTSMSGSKETNNITRMKENNLINLTAHYVLMPKYCRRPVHCTKVIRNSTLLFTNNSLGNRNLKLETKASSHEGQCIPAGYCHAHMLLYESGVKYNVNGKYTKYFAQLCVRIFTFSNISTTH